jgi:hypothetical protein
MRNSRVLPVFAAVVAVVAVVLGFSVLRTLSDDRSAGDTGGDVAAAGATGSPVRQDVSDEVDLDQGAVDPADVDACLVPDFASSAADVDVLYGQRQSTEGGVAPVLVLRNAAGDLRLCDAEGGDAPAEAPLPAPTPAEPVVFLSNGHSRWSCTDGKVLQGYRDTTWLAVAPEVATVQQRYWVDGVPGPWFTTSARDGYAHLQSWLTGPEPSGTRYAVEYRVRDADGGTVAQSALPTGKDRLPGCSGDGDAEIG